MKQVKVGLQSTKAADAAAERDRDKVIPIAHDDHPDMQDDCELVDDDFNLTPITSAVHTSELSMLPRVLKDSSDLRCMTLLLYTIPCGALNIACVQMQAQMTLRKNVFWSTSHARPPKRLTQLAKLSLWRGLRLNPKHRCDYHLARGLWRAVDLFAAGL